MQKNYPTRQNSAEGGIRATTEETIRVWGNVDSRYVRIGVRVGSRLR